MFISSTLSEYKSEIEYQLKRSDQLNIKRKRRAKLFDDSENLSDDSDFEDVIMEHLELGLEAPALFNTGKLSLQETKDDLNGASKISDLDEQNRPSTSKAEVEKPKKIPQIAFGLDLKYWGEKIQPAMVPRNEFDGHPFWRATDPGFFNMLLSLTKYF